MKKLVYILLFALLTNFVYSQEKGSIITRARIIDGDTVPYFTLPVVTIFSPLKFKNKRHAKRFSKLVRNVKRVYPYAKLTGIKMNEYSEILSKAKNDKERRKLMRKAEEELKAEFEKEIRRMNFSQGKILIKLIDRETGMISYKIVRELRGRLIASFWQSVGKVFGYNLKSKYDPKGKDRDIERIVIMIEAGAL